MYIVPGFKVYETFIQQLCVPKLKNVTLLMLRDKKANNSIYSNKRLKITIMNKVQGLIFVNSYSDMNSSPIKKLMDAFNFFGQICLLSAPQH